MTTRMVIFYNPTEARSTRRRPSPGLPLYGEEQEHSIAKVLLVNRACMLCALLGARKQPCPNPWGRRRGFSVPLLSVGEKNNLYGFSFAQRCILELSEALSLTKGK